MENNKKTISINIMVAAAIIMLLISANMELVKSQGSPDCYDNCSMNCVSYFPNQRRMSRCDNKCSILCSPEREANGNSK